MNIFGSNSKSQKKSMRRLEFSRKAPNGYRNGNLIEKIIKMCSSSWQLYQIDRISFYIKDNMQSNNIVRFGVRMPLSV